MNQSAKIIKFPGDPEKVLIREGIEKITKKLGWVYVLGNVAMPGLVKIGYTADCPYKRAKDISRGTGIPLPFDVIYATKTLFFAEIEARAHYLLAKDRINSLREFFFVSPEEAFEIVMILSNQMKDKFCTSETKIFVYESAIKLFSPEYDCRIENEPFFAMGDNTNG